MRVYFENPVGRLLEHPNGYALVQYNEGPRNFDIFRAFLTHTHLLLRRHGWHKMLADQRTMAPFSTEEQEWITTQWLAQSANDGYELYGAILISGELLASQPALKELLSTVQQYSALRYRLFEHEDEATAWLQTLP